MKNKYRAVKIVIDDIKFDSKREAGRYQVLKLLESDGKITDLELQPKYELIPKQEGERAVVYRADFRYIDTESGKVVVEDVKGMKTKDYIIKRKLFKLQNPEVEFKEI